MILWFWYSINHRNEGTNTLRRNNLTRESPPGTEKGGIIPVNLQWNNLVCPGQSSSVSEQSPWLVSSDFLRSVLINLIWFRYQNGRRSGFCLSHRWRPLVHYTKLAFFGEFRTKLTKNQQGFVLTFPPVRKKVCVSPQRDVFTSVQHCWSAKFHSQLSGRSSVFLVKKPVDLCPFSLPTESYFFLGKIWFVFSYREGK